ncbi:MAG: hypothetical protein B6D54_06150 [Epsilonproteobacteria bacterium 4484_65]|nr:MAG: hypothetical protein B6D54_06150 [Epsilonproteobacteria bacterium 4484_65]
MKDWPKYLLAIVGVYLLYKFTKKRKIKPLKPTEPIVGGPCEYEEVNGLCKLSVPYKINNKYRVNVSVVELEKGSIPEGRVFNLIVNGDYLTKEFLERNNIKGGETYKCLVKFIKKGTCTPIIIEIPGLGYAS